MYTYVRRLAAPVPSCHSPFLSDPYCWFISSFSGTDIDSNINHYTSHDELDCSFCKKTGREAVNNLLAEKMMTRPIRIITSIIAIFMLFPGTVKFFDPFKTMFTDQITKSELPFPAVSYWAGQLGEISVGLLLFGLLLFERKFIPVITNKIFYLGNFIVAVIMVVSIYVHMHPNVPADILPLEEKFPFLSILILFLVGSNLYLYKKIRD